MKSDLVELRVHAHRNEKLAVVVWSDAAWANRKALSSTPFLCRSSDNTNPARWKTWCGSSLSAEVQSLIVAEQELYFTRLQVAEFLGFSVNLW